MARRELEILVKVRDQITRPLQSIARRFTRFTTGIAAGFARATRSLFSMRSALVALGGVTAGIGISKRFTDAASSVETFRTQLRALIPDARQADAALAGIREFAASTPLETEEVVQAFVRLRAVGVPAAQEVTRALGGVALVFNRDLRDVASAFVSFETEPLRNLGVELRRTGDIATLVSGDIRVETDNTAQAIRQGLLDIWEKRFPDALQLGASTFRGTLSTFRSLIFDLSADIGENLLGPLTGGLRGINDRLIENRDRIVAAFVQLPQFFSRLAANVRSSLSSLLDPVVEGAQTLGDRVFAALAGFGAQFGSVLRAGAATGFQALLQVAQVSLRLLAATIERAVSQDSGAAIVRGVARLGQLTATALGETFKALSSILPGLLQTAAQTGLALLQQSLLGLGFAAESFVRILAGTISSFFQGLLADISNTTIRGVNNLIDIINGALPASLQLPRIELEFADSTEVTRRTREQVRESIAASAAALEAEIDFIFGRIDVPANLAPGIEALGNQIADVAARIGDDASLGAELEGLREQLNQLGQALGVDEATQRYINSVNQAAEATKQAREELAAAADASATAVEESTDRIEDGFNRQSDAADDAAAKLGSAAQRSAEIAQSAGETIQNSFVNAFANNLQGALNGVKSFKDAIKDMAVAVLQSIQQIILQMIALKIVSTFVGAFGGGFFGGGASAGGGGGGVSFGSGSLGSTTLSAPAFAKGGVVTGTQLAIVGDNPSGREAIVPLPDGRSIPARITGEDSGRRGFPAVVKAIRELGGALARAPQAAQDLVQQNAPQRDVMRIVERMVGVSGERADAAGEQAPQNPTAARAVVQGAIQNAINVNVEPADSARGSLLPADVPPARRLAAAEPARSDDNVQGQNQTLTQSSSSVLDRLREVLVNSEAVTRETTRAVAGAAGRPGQPGAAGAAGAAGEGGAAGQSGRSGVIDRLREVLASSEAVTRETTRAVAGAAGRLGQPGAAGAAGAAGEGGAAGQSGRSGVIDRLREVLDRSESVTRETTQALAGAAGQRGQAGAAGEANARAESVAMPAAITLLQKRLERSVPRFALGGIVSGSQLVVAGDNSSGSEAVVPLPDGRTIPVTVTNTDRGDTRGVTAIVDAINRLGIQMQRGSAATASVSRDSERILRQMIATQRETFTTLEQRQTITQPAAAAVPATPAATQRAAEAAAPSAQVELHFHTADPGSARELLLREADTVRTIVADAVDRSHTFRRQVSRR